MHSIDTYEKVEMLEKCVSLNGQKMNLAPFSKFYGKI